MSSSIVSEFFNAIDSVAADTVARTYQNLVAYYGAYMWSMASVYIGFQFLRAMQGARGFHHLIDHVFKVVIIMTLAMNYEYFCLFIYDVVTKEPLYLFKVMTANGQGTVSLGDVLDKYLNAGLDYSNKILMQGGWYNPTVLAYGLVVFLMTCLSSIISAGLIVLAKCASIILLSLSPLFIFFGLFDLTKNMFQSYLQMLITYALVPVLVSAILVILFNMSETVLAQIERGGTPSLTGILPFVFLCLIQFYLMIQVMAQAAALGGGFTLGSFYQTMHQAKDRITNGLLGRRHLDKSDLKGQEQKQKAKTE